MPPPALISGIAWGLLAHIHRRSQLPRGASSTCVSGLSCAHNVAFLRFTSASACAFTASGSDLASAELWRLPWEVPRPR